MKQYLLISSMNNGLKKVLTMYNVHIDYSNSTTWYCSENSWPSYCLLARVALIFKQKMSLPILQTSRQQNYNKVKNYLVKTVLTRWSSKHIPSNTCCSFVNKLSSLFLANPISVAFCKNLTQVGVIF